MAKNYGAEGSESKVTASGLESETQVPPRRRRWADPTLIVEPSRISDTNKTSYSYGETKNYNNTNLVGPS
jgi:hypothetical protein